MKTTIILFVVLALCAVCMEARPRGKFFGRRPSAGQGSHGGGRGHPGRGPPAGHGLRPWGRRPGLKDFVCGKEVNGEVSFNKTCRMDAECKLGPVTFDHDNDTVTLTFCDGEQTPRLLGLACRVENSTGAVIGEERPCREENSCSLGPLPLTQDGEDVSAYFCLPEARSGESSEDKSGRKFDRFGKHGKRGASSEETEEEEE